MVTKLPFFTWPRNIIICAVCKIYFLEIGPVHQKLWPFECMMLKTLNSNFLDWEDTLNWSTSKNKHLWISCIKGKLSAIFRLASGRVLCTRIFHGLPQEFRVWLLMLSLKAEEMLCESCSQRIGKFHQNGIVLIISHLNALIDNHIEEAERVNIDAVTRL